MYQNIPSRVLTGEVRLSYVFLSQPHANKQGGEPKYSVTMLIPKTDAATKAEIDATIKYVYEDAVTNNWKGARPQLRSALIYDGDGLRNDGSKFGPECAGHWVITASTKNKPWVTEISNINCELAPQDIYSGMYARVSLNFYPFNNNGNKGVGCGLRAVMKTRDGEPLAGNGGASDFEGIGQSIAPQASAPATPNYGAAMPATPGQVNYQNTGYTTAPVAPQINPITGLPM